MNILLLEDHPIFRFGVRQLMLNRWPRASVREAGTLAEGLARLRQDAADVAIVDLNLPDCAGLEVLAQLLRCAPGTHLIVLSMNDEALYAQRALQIGALGYLPKDRASEELVLAVERVYAGGRYITSTLAEQLAEMASGARGLHPHEALSAQEYRVMITVAQGQRISDIALSLNISPKTVSTYRARILDKLHLATNADLTRYCLAHKLIDGEAGSV
jgi:two-component system, NarL family, invasion response regulator UvrY